MCARRGSRGHQPMVVHVVVLLAAIKAVHMDYEPSFAYSRVLQSLSCRLHGLS